MPKAIKSQGVVIYYSTVGSPESYAAIGNVTGWSGPGGSAAIIDATNLDSVAKEKLIGLPDEGQFTINLNYDPDNAAHIALRAARKAGTLVAFKITLTDATATNIVFSGYVTGFQLKGQVNEKVTADLTIEIDGAVSEV